MPAIQRRRPSLDRHLGTTLMTLRLGQDGRPNTSLRQLAIVYRGWPEGRWRWPVSVMAPSSGWVVVGVGRVDTTTGRRVRRWVQDTVGPPVGVGSGGGPAIPGAGCGRRCR